MLRLIKIIPRARINNVYRCITSSPSGQTNAEMVQSQAKYDAIKIHNKRPKREPLVKNLFIGKVDTELLAFPEVIVDLEVLQTVYQRKDDYERFLKSEVFENPDDPANFQKLKTFGSFRDNTSTLTELLYGYSGPESKVPSYNNFLNSHQEVIQLIHEHGNEDQKHYFLPKLEAGGLVGVTCNHEPCASTNPKKIFVTQATFKDDTGKWILNGTKTFVNIRDKDTTLFVVLASSETVDHIGNLQDTINVFLVEGNTPGVSIVNVNQTIGYGENLFQQVTVSFNDVELPKINSFGFEFQDNLKSGLSLLRKQRMSCGAQILTGIMKPILQSLTDYTINTKTQPSNFKEMENVRERLGMLTCNYYVLESMLFMTSGLLDIYEDQDSNVEAAMIKAFALEMLTSFTNTPLHMIAGEAVSKSEPFERLLRDGLQLAATGETLNSVKLFIGLMGLNHAGIACNDTIKQVRNPFDHPAFIFNRIFKQSIQRPKMTLNLKFHLHPSLDPAAYCLEKSILRLKAATEIVLGRHGPEVVEHPVEIEKLSDAATLCYAMLASIARASRSYCIGLRNADQEVMTAGCFALYGMETVLRIATEIDDGEYATNEHNFKKLGEKLIESKGYFLEHPITRNF